MEPRDEIRKTTAMNAPATVVTVGNADDEHAGWRSSSVRPAGMNGSWTVPVGTGMTSEQSVSAVWSKPSRDILSIVASNRAIMFARSAVGGREKWFKKDQGTAREEVKSASHTHSGGGCHWQVGTGDSGEEGRGEEGDVPIMCCHSQAVRGSLSA